MRIKIGACEVNVPDHMVNTPEHKTQFHVFLRKIVSAQKDVIIKEMNTKYNKQSMGGLFGVLEDLERITGTGLRS